MSQKANFQHLKKGDLCKLCGSIAGQKRPGKKPSVGCSFSINNSQLFYCWRKRKIFFLDKQGHVLTSPKWQEVDCLLCTNRCISLIENPKQHWCKTLSVTYFLCNNGNIVCRSLSK